MPKDLVRVLVVPKGQSALYKIEASRSDKY